MKQISDMTEQEILALKTEDIDAMVRYQCAEQGVKLLQRPVEPVKPGHQPDLTFYEIGSFLFEKQEDALAVQQIAKKGKKAEYLSYASHIQIPKPVDEYSLKIDTVQIFSPDFARSIESTMENYRKEKEVYDKLNEEFSENEEQVISIRDAILERVYEVSRKYDALNQDKFHFAEYLSIAGGDQAMAKAFFEKAYGSRSEEAWAYILA